MQMTLTIEGLKQFLLFGSATGATGTDPLLKTAKVMIYVNNLAPTVNTLAADLTEASWTGYARSSTIVWGTPITSIETGIPAILGDAKVFTVTTQPTPAQVAYGYAIVTTVTAVDHLLAVTPFDQPIQPPNGTEFSVQPRIGLNQLAVNPSGDLTFQ